MEATAGEIPGGSVESDVPRRRSVIPTFSQADAMFVSAKFVREYVRSYMMESIIGRMYTIGLGEERFDTPTALGTVITIPAQAGDQIRALAKLIDVGVPSQIGLVDDDGQTLPGVFALGPLDLDAARREAQGDRYVPPKIAGTTIGDALADTLAADPALDSMDERIARGDFIQVEVEEGSGFERSADDQAPPPVVPPPEPTPEQIILARVRARKKNGVKK